MTTGLTQMVARGLLAPALIVALAILVKGYASVGDGFSAGVVAALGILLQMLAFGRDRVAAELPVHRAPAVAMLGLFIGFAVLAAPVLTGGSPLEHWPPPGDEPVYIGTVELITPVVFDIGVFLLVLGACVTIIDALAGAAEEEGT
jgi:multisubunit Na+/H+ antiporter MnhB subunit